jgi:hypothetical protein
MTRIPCIEAVGKVFGRLTVLSVRYEKRSTAVADCICACGKQHSASVNHLRMGRIVSCGCHKNANAGARTRTHGLSKTLEYKAWISMKDRCFNPRSGEYFRYGARGITVHRDWIKDFPAFLREVGRMPARGYQIERIDNNKGYEPGNVKWATRLEQARNTRRNRFLEWNGRRLTVSQWAEETGIPGDVITKRIDYLGCSIGEALTKPYVFVPRAKSHRR